MVWPISAWHDGVRCFRTGANTPVINNVPPGWSLQAPLWSQRGALLSRAHTHIMASLSYFHKNSTPSANCLSLECKPLGRRPGDRGMFCSTIRYACLHRHPSNQGVELDLTPVEGLFASPTVSVLWRLI